MKRFFIVSAFALCQGIYAQSQGVIYFDEEWNITKDKKKASFYRETTQQGDYYLIKDYYINGTLQMEGKASDKTPNQEVFDGKVIWYYPDGKVSMVSHFSKGVQVGEHKSYQEDGRISQDFIYKNYAVFSGKSYGYENDYQNNTITEYKDGDVVKMTTYGKSLQGIRFEEIYAGGDPYTASEVKYYDENGKYIGSQKINKDGLYTGINVKYYASPMKVSCIENFSGQSTTYDMPTESKCYYGNGKLKKTYKSHGKTATEVVYDESGKKIGSLEYRYDKEMDMMSPYNGEKIEIDLYEKTKKIISILTYKNGKGLEGKYFDQEGELQNQYFYDDEGGAKEIWSFGNGGKQVLTYRDGLPYNGSVIEGGAQSTYKDGLLMETREVNMEGKPTYEKKYDESKDIYEVKIYSDGKLKYYYTTNNRYDEDAYFSAEITPFDDKGKPMSKIVIKDGKIEKGVLKLKSYYADAETVEYSKKGKWYVKRTYVEKELVKEERFKNYGDYSDYFEIYEMMLRTE